MEDQSQQIMKDLLSYGTEKEENEAIGKWQGEVDQKKKDLQVGVCF